MSFRSLLITGGAGFVGANLAVLLKQHDPALQVLALDNLKRRGSELSLARLRAAGVSFVHADVRCTEDLAELPDFDLLIDCSAEPSVYSAASSPNYVLETNLTGTIHCLELVRQRKAAVVFLSTSRVYPIGLLNAIPVREDETRFNWEELAIETPGCSAAGISEQFPLAGARSFYGASKLASELICTEYASQFGIQVLINRCGILAGPWQMGKVDQGVIALWTARHYFKQSLDYIGFGGTGKQVRDILHIEDLFCLLVQQMQKPELWDGRAYNVGGGPDCSVSLLELTRVCEEVTGHRIAIGARASTHPLDVRIYLSDNRRASRDFDWQPSHTPVDIVRETWHWIDSNCEALRPVFCT